MWSSYFDQTKDRPPSQYLVQAIQQFPAPINASALDLGSGGGRDTRFLAQSGFKVTSVDAAPSAQTYINQLDLYNVTFVQSTFENFAFEQYDLVNASLSLPFVDRDKFNGLWPKIDKAVKPNGLFVGDFFGVRDSWNNNDNELTFHTEDQIRQLLANFQIHTLQEDEGEGHTISGEAKHWHIFHIIAQKKNLRLGRS